MALKNFGLQISSLG